MTDYELLNWLYADIDEIIDCFSGSNDERAVDT